MLPPALATLLTPKQKAGLEAESVDVLAVVVGAMAEVAVARPAKRGAAGAAAAVVGLKEKGAGKGTDAGGPRSPKMGLKVGVAVLVVMGWVELETAAAVTDVTEGPSLSLLGGVMKMGLNMGEAEDVARAAGVAGEAGAAGAAGVAAAAGAAGAAGEGAEGMLLDMPNSPLCLEVGEGVGGPRALADVSV